MGKKGGQKKGKPIVMTQQEFFQSQLAQPAEPNYANLFKNQQKDANDAGGSWDKVDLYGQNQGKVVVASKEPEKVKETKVEEEKKVVETVKEEKKEEEELITEEKMEEVNMKEPEEEEEEKEEKEEKKEETPVAIAASVTINEPEAEDQEEENTAGKYMLLERLARFIRQN